MMSALLWMKADLDCPGDRRLHRQAPPARKRPSGNPVVLDGGSPRWRSATMPPTAGFRVQFHRNFGNRPELSLLAAISPLRTGLWTDRQFFRSSTPEASGIFDTWVHYLDRVRPSSGISTSPSPARPDGIFPPKREKLYFDGSITLPGPTVPASLRVRGNLESAGSVRFRKLKLKVPRGPGRHPCLERGRSRLEPTRTAGGAHRTPARRTRHLSRALGLRGDGTAGIFPGKVRRAR